MPYSVLIEDVLEVSKLLKIGSFEGRSAEPRAVVRPDAGTRLTYKYLCMKKSRPIDKDAGLHSPARMKMTPCLIPIQSSVTNAFRRVISLLFAVMGRGFTEEQVP